MFRTLLVSLIVGAVVWTVAALPCVVSPPTIWRKDPRSSSALFQVTINGRAGYIDSTGNLVIPPEFTPFSGDFLEGVALVSSNNQAFFIDESGRKLRFHDDLYGFQGFSDSLTIARRSTNGRDSGKALLVDHSGQIVATVDAYWVQPFSEGLAAFAETKGWGVAPAGPTATRFGHKRGYLNKSGKVVIPAKFSYAGPFSEGLAAVALDGQCWVAGVGASGRDAAPSANVQFTSCGPQAAPTVIEPCRHGYIDKTGHLRIPARYELAQDFSDGCAGVRINGKWGFIDRSGTEITPFRFDEVKPFSEARAAVRVGRKWGYIDHSGKIVIPAEFDDALTFSSGLAAVKNGRHYSYISDTGDNVIHGPYIQATQFVKGLANVKIAEAKWAWIDTTGKAVFAYDWKW